MRCPSSFLPTSMLFSRSVKSSTPGPKFQEEEEDWKKLILKSFRMKCSLHPTLIRTEFFFGWHMMISANLCLGTNVVKPDTVCPGCTGMGQLRANFKSMWNWNLCPGGPGMGQENQNFQRWWNSEAQLLRQDGDCGGEIIFLLKGKT